MANNIRQILYVSQSTIPGDSADLAGILLQSRHNNALDGVTGLLWSDGERFLQIFEGPEESVCATFARIANDDRHCEMRIILDRLIEAREFSDWTMAHRRADEPADIYDAKVRRLLSKAAPPIKDAFFSMIAYSTR